jgi:3',5'-cyclic AMP phosphodiesterase CpdA
VIDETSVARSFWRAIGVVLLVTMVAPPAREARAQQPDTRSVLVGAGDIGECGGAAEETAKLVEKIRGTVFTAGDNAYPNGTSEEFERCYAPTWGRFRARTRPALGNHDARMAGALAYYDYFGAAAGEPGKGYYSYELGSWRIIVLNSNCGDVGGCGAGSPQERWLQTDLAGHPSRCTLAIWHHPLFSSGWHGGSVFMRDAWRLLYSAGAEIVVNGHDHDYERFAPQDPDGRRAPGRGIAEFVVGTGGAHLRPFRMPAPNSEARSDRTHGVLELTLHPDSYEWKFIPVAGETFSDSGEGVCH